MNHSQKGAEGQESLSEVNLGVGNVGWGVGAQGGQPGDSLQGKALQVSGNKETWVDSNTG